MKKTSKKIYLISDSTGELAERFTNALASQFPENKIVVKKYSFVAEPAEADRLIGQFSPQDSILFHTVLSNDLKKAIQAASRKKNIESFDLTGPAMEFMTRHLGIRPVPGAAAIHPIDEEYEKRVQAIEFTINHDDGAGAKRLDKADIILVGPSRSSKTPTSMYLAVKGFKVANIPLVREVDMSDYLEKLKNDERVFAFSITPHKLCEMRLRRVEELGTNPDKYTDIKEIQKEMVWVRELYRRYQWRVIDVTDRAIEETAALILKTRRPRQ